MGRNFSVLVGRLLVWPIGVLLNGSLYGATLGTGLAFEAAEKAKEIALAHTLYLKGKSELYLSIYLTYCVSCLATILL